MTCELCILQAPPTQAVWSRGDPNSYVRTVIVPIKTFRHNYLVHENFHCKYSQFNNNQEPGIHKIGIWGAFKMIKPILRVFRF